MKMYACRRAGLLAFLLLGVAAPAAWADTYSASAFDNATVEPAGPRTGSNGKDFLDFEGLNNGSFSSFGVLDVHSGDLGIGFSVSDIASVSVSLTQANASFTANGPLYFYVTGDTNTSIQPGSRLSFNRTYTEGLDAQLTPRYFLGAGYFTQSDDGTVDTYTFQPHPVLKALLIDQINHGRTLRVIVSPRSPDVAATYAGFSNGTYSGPILTLDVQ